MEDPATYKTKVIRNQSPVGRLKNSFKFAFQGWKELYRDTPNFKIHLVSAVVVVIAGFIFKISSLEWISVVLAITLVWFAEAMNSAIENIVDMVSPEFNPQAGKIKDISAGAVLFCALGALVTACIIFIPKVYNLFFPV